MKFYYDPLASGDDFTPTLELDYGRKTITLTDGLGNSNVSFSNDGTNNPTSKRFEVREDCESVRPIINWTAGDVAISRIVIDYSIINDS